MSPWKLVDFNVKLWSPELICRFLYRLGERGDEAEERPKEDKHGDEYLNYSLPNLSRHSSRLIKHE